MERALESTACTVHYNLPQTGLDHTVRRHAESVQPNQTQGQTAENDQP